MVMFAKKKGLGRIALAGAASLLALGAAEAQTLTVMQSEAPRSMDPADQTASFTQVVLAPMYEGLIERNRELEIVPALATEWETSDDGLAWTFTLRENVQFHDGTPLDADAVTASFERLLNPELGLAAAGKITGLLERVEAVDPSTVRFTLARPYAGFADLMATSVGWVVSPAAGELGTHAVGTGPFEFTEYQSGDHVTMQAFDGYWGDAPSLDEIVFTWSAESSVLTMGVQSGEVDVVNPLPPVFAQAVSANPDLTLIDQPGAFVFWVSLNVELEPLDQKSVRQALNYATDREALVEALLRGYGTPANSPLAPTNPAWDESLNPYPYDPEMARSLLEDAGLGNGFSMSVAVQEPEAAIAEALQAMWAEIGVDLEVRRLESGVWSEAAFNGPEAKAEDDLGAVIASWSSGSVNADLQFRPLYTTGAWAPTGANLGFFSSEELDALVDEAAATLDATQRNALYVEAQEIVNEEAPHVLLYSTRDLAAASSEVEGLWLQPGGLLMVEDASITE
ncbi:ABC transporter substrate-binding protein [Palleronia sp. LCG004]|uniref:ABC transporter substrate-binding protein n=1 Tax=Palleronia sp. LCG004 TaxID=3079304 RepID=UPI002941BFE9|nr:ABC transporter substrate-binding protein [Palleronia sp. LCG004]WOI58309.1 ABC transporter substrate-binding protein [Palleronia sp. LCG004]